MASLPAPTDAQNLAFALGLGDRKLTSFTLRAAVNEFVTLDTTEIALKESVQGLTREVVERQYRMVRWIPIEESLPAVGEDVIIWDEFNLCARPAKRSTDGPVPYFYSQGVGYRLVKHWMPKLWEPE
jgi:hypothetical protein